MVAGKRPRLPRFLPSGHGEPQRRTAPPPDDDTSGEDLLKQAAAQEAKIVKQLTTTGAVKTLLAKIKVEKTALDFYTACYPLDAIVPLEIDGESVSSTNALKRLSHNIHTLQSREKGEWPRFTEPSQLIELLEKHGFELSGELAKHRDKIMAQAKKGRSGGRG